jgi:hypothetical protein
VTAATLPQVERVDQGDTAGACAAGCGWPLDPAAAAGGFDRHPGCEPGGTGRPATGWRCIEPGCTAHGPANGDRHAVALISQHRAAPVRAGGHGERR